MKLDSPMGFSSHGQRSPISDKASKLPNSHHPPKIADTVGDESPAKGEQYQKPVRSMTDTTKKTIKKVAKKLRESQNNLESYKTPSISELPVVQSNKDKESLP